jgi:hypothetical protein
MQITCPRCQAVLEYTSRRPSFCSQCGSSLRTPDPAQTIDYTPAGTPGDEAALEVVGGYRLLRPLGSGGMGTVYEAEDASSGRRVAVKLLSEAYTASADAAERFRREGRLASALAHPRCVFVFAADEEDGRPYIVMELMPGDTLEDLVQRRGPLPAGEAIALALDVIEGLEEAHKLGIVHRDVKPSNCFLDADGRVKVGDFGLSKTLDARQRLTRTGSFLGTPLFASPEQIKGEPVDAQADVYSVCATLYCLLTGRAPFQGSDAAATLARIVSEPAPPLRGLRPGIDPGLERVVLRGLERDRGRRWRDLGELREALRRCQPEQLSAGGLGLRFVAYLTDRLVLFLLFAGLTFALGLFFELPDFEEMTDPDNVGYPGVMELVGPLVAFAYYTLLEGLWGLSLGKLLLRLRVCRPGGSSPPGLLRGAVRSLGFEGLHSLGTFLWFASWWLLVPPGASLFTLFQDNPVAYLAVSFSAPGGMILGIVLLLGPMRRRTGYRGLHEWISGTRVVSLPPRTSSRHRGGLPSTWELSRPQGMPARLGPFVVRGALRWDDEGKVLLGEDSALGREVWLWLRPAEEPPLSEERRQVSRTTRLRWLACGVEEPWQWDAFVALPGRSLPDLVRVRGRLSWAEARPLLEQLIDELAEADEGGLLPEALGPGQVWVRPDGTAQLLDVPLRKDDSTPRRGESVQPALALAGEAAALLLEGKPRQPRDRAPVRAPLPGRISPLLGRLLGSGIPYASVRELRADLRRQQAVPAEVDRLHRFAHLGMQALLLSVGLGSLLFLGMSIGYLEALTVQLLLTHREAALDDLEQASARELVYSAIHPDARVRLQGAAQWQADRHLADRLRRQIERDRRYREALLASLGGIARQQLRQSERLQEEQLKAIREQRGPRAPVSADLARQDARNALHTYRPVKVRGVFFTYFFGILLWPAVWMLWAFLTRGGISLRMTGLALVRADGRRAARWQCLWRAFLVWAPVAGLLAATLLIDVWYWSAWRPDDPRRWAPVVSSLCWYAGAGLLLVYVALALWSPRRGPHDRLAGTYLVPR